MSNQSRLNQLETFHGLINTPVFMPCGTKATVKSISPEELMEIETQILLGNTYHLYLRPGNELIAKFGGLHKFMGWSGPILTDSGGFQAFSLGAGNKEKPLTKLTDEGIEFRSHLDGSVHLFTPEKVIDIQRDLRSDVMMPLDVCNSAECSYEEAKRSLALTHKWWDKAWKYYNKTCDTKKQFLFPIIQGAGFEDLRKESAEFFKAYPVKGLAIGSIGNGGESKELMYKQSMWVADTLGDDPRPRYIMGIGEPEDLLEFVSQGFDMFDCVIPTRLGRHGVAYTTHGKINLKNASFKEDMSILDENEWVHPSMHKYTKGYLRHLISEDEMLGARLLSFHNIFFLHRLMKLTRENIKNGTFEEFKTEFLSQYLK